MALFPGNLIRIMGIGVVLINRKNEKIVIKCTDNTVVIRNYIWDPSTVSIAINIEDDIFRFFTVDYGNSQSICGSFKI